MRNIGNVLHRRNRKVLQTIGNTKPLCRNRRMNFAIRARDSKRAHRRKRNRNRRLIAHHRCRQITMRYIVQHSRQQSQCFKIATIPPQSLFLIPSARHVAINDARKLSLSERMQIGDVRYLRRHNSFG